MSDQKQDPQTATAQTATAQTATAQTATAQTATAQSANAETESRQPGENAPAAERAAVASEQLAAAADDKARITALEAEVERLKDERLRALAEVENVRRRAARDKADAAKYAVSGFARDILAVADNLKRAIGAVDEQARGVDPALDGLIVGVQMTEKELLAVFQRHGITPIEAEGQPFDPHVHDAMYEVPDPSVPAGTVVHVVEPGFMIHDRPLRPARVGVSSGGPKPAPKPPGAAPEGDGAAPDSRASAYDRKPETSGGAAGSTVDETL